MYLYGMYRRRSWWRTPGDYIPQIGLSCLAVFLAFVIIDCGVGCSQGKWQPVYGKVHDKEYSDWKDSDGHRHESWTLKVIAAGSEWTNVDVSQRQYVSVCTGDSVRLVRRTGGLTGWTYNYGFDARVNPKDIPGETQ